MILVWLAFIGVSAALVAYAYVGYPLLLKCLSAGRARAAPSDSPNKWPRVSIVVPAYNEEATIRGTLESLLQIDYPAEQRQIVVISDGSTDRTEAVVSEFAERGVELVCLPSRKGKSAAENAGRPHLRGAIVVSTDASVRIDPAGLKRLVAGFSDPSLGVASGRDVSVARIGDTANLGESVYVGYDMWVRDLETRVGSIVGASGCFYGARRELYMEMVPEALSRDFAMPLIAHERGYRSVSVPSAVCYVPRASSLRQEYRRKVRTMARGLGTLVHKRHLLLPWRYGRFAWMLFSHKLARWLVPWAVLGAVVGVAGTALAHQWGQWLLGAGVIVAVLGGVGVFWPGSRPVPRIVGASAYVLLGLAAGLHAWIKVIVRRDTPTPTWEPTRRDLPNVG